MYLEISGRRSGKTTRIINAVEEYILEHPDESVLIVSPWGAKEFQLPHRAAFASEFQLRIQFADRTREGKMNFIDEFDWFEDPSVIGVNTSWHYATTPKKVRRLEDLAREDDLLINLIKANDWKCMGGISRHLLVNMPFITETSVELRKTYTGQWVE